MSNSSDISEETLAHVAHGQYGDLVRRMAVEIQRRRSSASEGGASNQWHPISTAPRDGTHIILGWPASVSAISRPGFYLDNSNTKRPWQGWRGVSLQPFPAVPPTHWQPMPPPPQAPGEVGEVGEAGEAGNG